MSDALELRGLQRHYGDVRAVDGVDLSIPDGERFALLGPSGSGKTTILRLVAGFEQPDAGHIRLGGVDVAGLPPERRNVGVVFQDYALFPHRTVAANIEFGLRMRGVDKPRRRARVQEMLTLVGLTREADRRPGQLSGGQRQRVALARALAPEPSLLLLDEPLANLDRRLRESLRAELTEITGQVGITTVLVTHDQEEALSFADRVGVLAEGRLAQVGEPAAVWRTPGTRFVATFLGDMNLVPAEVRPDGTVCVPGIATPLSILGGRPFGSGDGAHPVVACLRPEALAVSADPDGNARVVAVTYTGGSATYQVAVDKDAVDKDAVDRVAVGQIAVGQGAVGEVRLLVREAQPDGRPALAVGDPVVVRALVEGVQLLPA